MSDIQQILALHQSSPGYNANNLAATEMVSDVSIFETNSFMSLHTFYLEAKPIYEKLMIFFLKKNIFRNDS